MPKAVQSVTVRDDALALHVIEHLAHLLRREFVVVEKRNEAGDCPLKINIIFPKRIVRVDQKCLWKQSSSSRLLANKKMQKRGHEERGRQVESRARLFERSHVSRTGREPEAKSIS